MLIYIAILAFYGQFYCDIHTLELRPSMAWDKAWRHVV